MADIVLQKNVGALIDAKLLGSLSWTAGGNLDNAPLLGSGIDREGFATGSMPRSMDVQIAYAAKLGSGNTLSFTLDVQSAPDNATWTDYLTEVATVAATGPSGGTPNQAGVLRMVTQSTADNPAPGPGLNLGGAQRYVRLKITPHLSAAGTDTGMFLAVGVFGGFDQLAAPAT